MRTKKSLLDLAVQLQTGLPSETASPAHNKCLLKAGQLEMVLLRTVRHSLPRAEGFELEIWTQVGMAAGLASLGTFGRRGTAEGAKGSAGFQLAHQHILRRTSLRFFSLFPLRR